MIALSRNIAMVICLVTAVLVQAEDKHPYASAKVGDWIEYKMSMKMGEITAGQTMKQTVTKKTETEVTVEMSMNVNGQEMKNSIVIKLNEKYEPFKQEDKDAKVKVLGSGSEKITIKDKTYDTTWTEAEVTA